MNIPPLAKIVILPFKILLILISSWILVHIFAFLGIFFFIGYPIWWIFFPQISICFGCRSRKDGEYCHICKNIVDKSKGTHPKTFRSAMINSLVILLISIFSIGTVYLEYSLIKTDPEVNTIAFDIPSDLEHKNGEIFQLMLEISPEEYSINAVQTDISFDKDKLEVLDISIKDSFAKIFIEKNINNDLGYLRLSGGLPNPGFSGESGIFGTIFFKTKSPGIAQVSFLQTSMVLANDGKGTNILGEYPTISYIIRPEYITESERILQEQIYQSSVLGITEKENKLIFFNSQNDVLGTKDIIMKDSKTHILDTVKDKIIKTDRFLLSIFNLTEI